MNKITTATALVFVGLFAATSLGVDGLREAIKKAQVSQKTESKKKTDVLAGKFKESEKRESIALVDIDNSNRNEQHADITENISLHGEAAAIAKAKGEMLSVNKDSTSESKNGNSKGSWGILAGTVKVLSVVGGGVYVIGKLIAKISMNIKVEGACGP